MKLNKKGFTLIELVVTIVILTLFASIMIPSFISMMQNAREQKDTTKYESISTALKIAMSEEEVRSQIKNVYGDKEFTISFPIENGHIEFADGLVKNSNASNSFGDTRLGLSTYQTIGTFYNIEKDKYLNGALVFTCTPKTSTSMPIVTYQLLLEGVDINVD